ncbi:HNH endonuclease signature motif containing protein [Gryllotalpicola protaetiae]|uniref:HNH endonuclease n=1 Tax=Gryllotalpicola protaetiae TaxID=2419771 RepID=A0A387BQL0_9MICO|nr:HNH endonuclease signature motif containing protein [Gryllotalpicola protaetiae]AYG03379.1 HNH endonuclease [Gryllotalpicola protaetiae]
MASVGSTAAAALENLLELLPVDPCELSDRQVVDWLGRVTEAKRHIEALELAGAAEVNRRSDPEPGGDSLAKRLGHKTPAQAVEAMTGSSAKSARRLIADVEDLAKLPVVEAAVLDGRIGRDSAEAIAVELKKAIPTADAGRVAVAESELVRLATGSSADRVREEAQKVAAELSPESIDERAKRAHEQRYFWIGKEDNGLAPVSGRLPVEVAAKARMVLDGFASPKRKVSFADAGDGGADAPADTRTIGQKYADGFDEVFSAQARIADKLEVGGDHPTVWVTTTEAELAAGKGLAFFAGASEPTSVQVARKAVCTGGLQEVVLTETGAFLRLGRSKRAFSRRQRRAMAARDGGECIIPGCRVPAYRCEAHHVISWFEGGPTDVGNGVLVCPFHHDEVEKGPWQLKMVDGRPWVRWSYGGKTTEWQPVGSHLTPLSAT